MPKRKDTNPDDAAIRARINILLDRHTKAEVARKTGTPAVNVGRYSRDTQIPASYCTSLARAFGLNTAWLLLGDGHPTVTESSDRAQEEAGDLLQVIKAMSVVTRMKLGAIGSGEYARMLREISDALATHQRMKEKLGAHVRDVFAKILDDLHLALGERDVKRAVEIRKVAVQVSHLCDDEMLQRRFASEQAHLDLRLSKPHLALEHYRRVMLHILSKGQFPDDESFISFTRVGQFLLSMGRLRDALRVTEAAIALAGPEAETLPLWPQLAYGSGDWLVDLGYLNEGLARLNRCIPRLSGAHRRKAKAMLVRALLVAGTVNVAEAIEMDPHDVAKANWTLIFAAYTEDAVDLEKAVSYREGPRVIGAYFKAPLEFVHGKFVLQALAAADGAKPPLEEYDSAMAGAEGREDESPRWVFRAAALRAQFVRLAISPESAAPCTEEADRLLLALDASVALDVISHAIHCRNVLLCKPHAPNNAWQSAVERATAFLANLRARNYQGLAPQTPQE